MNPNPDPLLLTLRYPLQTSEVWLKGAPDRSTALHTVCRYISAFGYFG